MKQAPLSQEEYAVYMDDLMERVLSVLHGEHTMEIAGVAIGLLGFAMAHSPSDARLEIVRWIRKVLEVSKPNVH
jgi:hypothetical protein